MISVPVSETGLGPLCTEHRSHKAIWLQTVNYRFRGGEEHFIALLPFGEKRRDNTIRKGKIMRCPSSLRTGSLRCVAMIAVILLCRIAPVCAQSGSYEFNDSHFHLTNNVQDGPTFTTF